MKKSNLAGKWPVLIWVAILVYQCVKAKNYTPIFIFGAFFAVIFFINTVIIGKKKPREELPPQPQRPAEKTDKPDDFVTEFERKLKQRTEQEAAAKAEAERLATKERLEGRVNPARTDSQRVRTADEFVKPAKDKVHKDGEVVHDTKGRIHYDDEVLHDSKGRVHTEKESLKHDKSKVYYDPRGDYSYDEERMNAEVAAFRAQRQRNQEAHKPKLKLKHGALVQGFLMSEVLKKPRAFDEHIGEY